MSAQPTNIPPQDALTDGMIDSAFVVRLRAAFSSVETASTLWDPEFVDPDSSHRITMIADDITSAVRSLFLLHEAEIPPQPGRPHSASEVVGQVLEETGWPTNDEEVPVPEGWDHGTFRRYEVACAMYILMRAFHKGDPGGGDPADFPPTRPP